MRVGEMRVGEMSPILTLWAYLCWRHIYCQWPIIELAMNVSLLLATWSSSFMTRSMMMCSQLLVHFDPKLEIRLACDALAYMVLGPYCHIKRLMVQRNQ